MSRGLGIAGVLLALAIPGCRRAPAASPEARAKLDLLEAILASHNDNDPRLDSAFVDLTPEAKSLFRAKYAALARERRNERGTIVYLLGKNLRAPEDWAFLREVVAEPPCLSLADCGQRSGGPAEPGDGVTLAYPQLVALTQAARAASPEGRGVLETARASKDAKVAAKAAALSGSLDPR